MELPPEVAPSPAAGRETLVLARVFSYIVKDIY
jgi:hypothetical protein